MSFLRNVFNTTRSLVTGSGFIPNLARVALLGFALNRLNKNITQENNRSAENIDTGVRLQVEPNAQQKIPVLYGEANFGGNIFDARQDNNNETMWFALALCEKTGPLLSGGNTEYSFNNIYLNNQRIVFKNDGITVDFAVDRQGIIDRSADGLIQVYLYAGGVDQGQLPEGFSGNVPNAANLFPGWSTNTHNLEDLVFAIIRVDYNRDKGVTSLGNWLFDIENNMKKPGDVLFDYFSDDVYGLGVPATNQNSLIELNDYSDESVQFIEPGVGTVTLPNRYQINGLIDTANNVFNNAEKIANACASWINFNIHTGEWSLIINKETSVTASFSDDNIIGNISLGSTGLTELYNGVKTEFPNRDLRDSRDFVKIQLPEEDLNPSESTNTLNLAYDIINEQVQAELLSLIELKQSRVDLIIEFEADYSYVGLRAGEVVAVTNSRYGFVNKEFRIISITERQDDGGSITASITALEYDADVYSFDDITRFTRVDQDGLITLGSLGAPSTPVVNKFETASRPRVEITTETPTGIVEGLEFWITFDVGVISDTDRNYTLFAVQKPSVSNVYPPSTSVTTEFDNLNPSNFFVKARAFNKVTTGLFSQPSGLVEFAPTQTTDAITPDTAVQDGLGGLATALGILELLGAVDNLFSSADGGGLFDRIFEVFKDETGEDILEEAKEGSVGGLAVQDDGSLIPVKVTNIDFGTGLDVIDNSDGSIQVNLEVESIPQQVTQQNLANFVVITNCPANTVFGDTVTISAELFYLDCDKVLAIPYTITGVDTADIDVPLTGTLNFVIEDGQVITTNFPIEIFNTGQTETKTLSFSIGCKLCEFDISPTAIVIPLPDVSLLIAETLPVDKSSWDLTDGLAPPLVPHTGSYFVRFVVEAAFQSTKPYVIEMTLGTGDFYLYKSDGTLADTVAAQNCTMHGDVVEIPFATRLLGTDYYVNWDQGVVLYCDAEAVILNDAVTWNFSVSPFAVDPFDISDIPSSDFDEFTPQQPSFNPLTVVSITPGNLSEVCSVDDITVTFSEAIVANTGSITITELATGASESIAIAQATISGSTATFTPSLAFQPELQYQVAVPNNLVSTNRQPQNIGVCGVFIQFTPTNTNNISRGTRFSIAPEFALIDYNLNSFPFTDPDLTQVNIRSNIELVFNKSFLLGTAPTIELYEDGNLIQTFDLLATFGSDQVGEIVQFPGTARIRLNPTKIMKPGSSYYINIPADTLFDSQCSTALPAITDTNTISWQTDAPTVSDSEPFNPADNPDPNIAVISYELDRPVEAGPGTITITDENGNVLAVIPSDSPAVTIG